MKHAMRWVVLLLVLGLVAAGWAIHAGSVAPTYFGPRLMSLDGAGRLWLVVDHQLFITDQAGRVIKQLDLSSVDGGMPVNGLVPLPSSRDKPRMLVAAIGQPQWWGMEDAEIVERYTPEGAGQALSEAFHVMSAPDGRIALATGGDHRLLLFDRQGRSLATSAPGTFRFANGGEFVAAYGARGAWLVSDTNRQRLLLLDADSLDIERIIDLAGGWLSMARKGPVADRYTVVLMDGDMDTGRVVEVDDQGSQVNSYPLARGAKPRGLIWIEETLLVADAASYTFQAFSMHGAPLGEWGSAELRGILARQHDEAEAWRNARLAGQVVAVLALLAALAVFFSARRIRPDEGAAPALNLSYLGTPTIGLGGFLGTGLRLYAPALILGAVILLLAVGDVAMRPAQSASREGLDAFQTTLWLLAAVLMPVALLYGTWRVQKRPEFEAYLSFSALRALRAEARIAKTLESGETVREVLSAWHGQVIVLTDRRLLVFRRGLDGQGRMTAFKRGALRAELSAPRFGLGWHRLRLKSLTRDRAYVIASPLTAHRIVDLVNMSPPRAARRAERPAEVAPAPRTDPATPATVPSDSILIVLTLLLPGLAQWLQNRFSQALMLIGLSLLLYAWGLGPILLGIWGHHYEVSALDIGIFLLLLLLVIFAALQDALMYARYKRMPLDVPGESA